MLDFIVSIPDKIIEHFAAMTTFVFVATVIKIILPLIGYCINRIFEYRTYKRWLKVPGMTEERARIEARNIWRPKYKPPKWLIKIKEIFFPTKNL
ncbi:MAG: hypothetical protein E7K70_29310 [Klebsiella sp.]|uniref:hypothetical protein n=1 Tax=Klebsiella TaxID=570 RepID=UPI000EFC2681|nr:MULTISPECIES: hypothetical protein [Klebsiella]MDU7531118.1 hypothetical protein [Klebsiella sp.]RMC91067.1 hypothetical protein EBH72_15685 [Klebsiella michiganensis]